MKVEIEEIIIEVQVLLLVLTLYSLFGDDSAFGRLILFAAVIVIPASIGSLLIPQTIMYILYGDKRTDQQNNYRSDNPPVRFIFTSTIHVFFYFLCIDPKQFEFNCVQSSEWLLVFMQSITMILTFDGLLYLYHYAQHSITWFRKITQHKGHHRMRDPNIFVSKDSSLMDGLGRMLVEICGFGLHLLFCRKVFIASMLCSRLFSAFWTTMIHNKRELAFFECFDKIGLITSKYHHVHHLNPNKNVGHIVKMWDLIGNTSLDPRKLNL